MALILHDRISPPIAAVVTHRTDRSPVTEVVEKEEHSGRRRLLRRFFSWVGLGATAASGSLAACTDGAATAAASSDPSSALPLSARAPALGVHALSYNMMDVASPALGVSLGATRDSGSTLLISVGRGASSAHAVPTDSKANIFLQVGATRRYSLWPDSGTALFACAQAAGGSGHAVSVAKAIAADETTLSAVEIVNGGTVVDWKWSEVLKGRPTTSEFVTTTGPALIVAWWWGDAGVAFDKTAVPDNGFGVIDSILRRGALVQCAVAVRQVSVAGTYRTTWTSTPRQGAQLWIAAVQNAF